MQLPTECPRCHADVEHGAIAGQGMYLTWVPDGGSVGWVTFGKQHLATGGLLRPPTLEAGRCTSCGLGIFTE